jgi:hypothetical protein
MHLVNAVHSVHFHIFGRVVGETYNHLCAKGKTKNGGCEGGDTNGRGRLKAMACCPWVSCSQ